MSREAATSAAPSSGAVDPATWPAAARAGLLAAERRVSDRPAEITARQGLVVATSNPFAARAGLEMLKAGGSAADAALATAITQIALWGGAAVSYAGVMTAVCHDAASGQTRTLNAAYDTVRAETDPLSIPGMGQHSGRSALTPGFMAGVQAMHDCYGKRPFAELFQAAIWVAEAGIEAGIIAGWLQRDHAYIARLPEGRAIFLKPDGAPYGASDRFRQPQLAATLRRVAADGADYIYRGDWARGLVDAVRREGGAMTLDDLAAYRPTWGDPARAAFRGFEVACVPPPSFGGLVTLASLRLAERLDVRRHGPSAGSALALYNLVGISRTALSYGYMTPEQRLANLPGLEDASDTAIISDPALAAMQYAIEARATASRRPPPISEHSAAIVAADRWGNVVSLLHSCNCVCWGATGIVVDGVPIPDSAAFQQAAIRRAGPGARLPDPTNPLIVFRDGKPFLASATIGAGLHPDTLQNLVNVLALDMRPQQSGDQPKTQGPYLGVLSTAGSAPEYAKEAVTEGDFADAVLDDLRALGQPVEVIPKPGRQFSTWIGLRIDDDGVMRSGADSYFPAPAEGY